MIDLSKYHFHDLTLSYSEKIAGYDFEIAKTIDRDGWNARILHIYSHAGTHMDAPVHFGVGDDTIDRYKPTQLMGAAWVVTIPIHESNQLLTVNDLGNVTSQFKNGESLIIRTGWSQYVGKDKYRNELPRISVSLAKWCVENEVKILGVEPPSVADVNKLDEVTQIHEILLRGKVIIVEGLTNLAAISKNKVFLVALPLKIKEGDGSPARVIAFEEKT